MSMPGLYATDRLTKGELETLASKHGWKPRKLAFADLQSMSSKELNYHEQFNAENLKAAMDEPARKAKAAKQRVKDMWDGKLPDLDAAAYKAVNSFCEKHPQFIRDEPNALALCNETKRAGLDGTEEASYIQAFQTLAARGELHLNPSALGLGTEERISGYTVTSHPQLYKLLQAKPTAEQTEREKVGKMSADDFKKEYLQEAGVPYHIQARMKRAADTLVSWHADFVIRDDNIELIVRWINENKLQYDMNGFEAAYQTLSKSGKLELRSGAIARAGETTMTNFEPRETGEPEVAGKLAAKIRSLSSDQYLEFLRNNKSARAAIDSM